MKGFRSAVLLSMASAPFDALGFSAPSLTVSIASRTVGGSDPNRPQKVNQDALFVCDDGLPNGMTCFGVMDGHGVKGHLVTQFLAKQLPRRIAQQLEHAQPVAEWEEEMRQLANFNVNTEVQDSTQGDASLQGIHNALRHAFHQAHVDAMNEPNVPAGRSGTTCIVCVVDATHIHVAYVGDSRALQVRLPSSFNDEKDSSSSSLWQTLATETTVSNSPQDAQRIQEKSEGRIDSQGNVWYGPVGISMTRALGDAVMLRAGVVPTPIVQSVPRKDSAIIVAATDGIWDVLSNDRVCKILQDEFSPSSDMEGVLDQLIAEARQKWIGNLPISDEEKVDDITCVIAKL